MQSWNNQGSALELFIRRTWRLASVQWWAVVCLKCQNNKDSAWRAITKFVWQMGGYKPSSPIRCRAHPAQQWLICEIFRSYPLKRTKAKKKQDPPLSYSSSLVIYTSRGDETTTTTTEDSDATTSTSNRSRNPNRLETSHLQIHIHDKEPNYQRQRRHSVTYDPRENFHDGDDYASLPTLKPGVESPERSIAENVVYQPIKQPERVFKVISDLLTSSCKLLRVKFM